jgi:dienelactone hydrolase
MQRAFLLHPQHPSKQLEVFWTTAVGQGPWPAVLFIHGHQEQYKNGGAAYIKTGRLGSLASRGYVAAAVSQPGYGHSDGPPDFCGPFTQAEESTRDESFSKEVSNKSSGERLC